MTGRKLFAKTSQDIHQVIPNHHWVWLARTCLACLSLHCYGGSAAAFQAPGDHLTANILIKGVHRPVYISSSLRSWAVNRRLMPGPSSLSSSLGQAYDLFLERTRTQNTHAKHARKTRTHGRKHAHTHAKHACTHAKHTHTHTHKIKL